MDYLVYQISEMPPAERFAGVLSHDELEMARSRGEDYARIRGVLRQELARRCHCAAHEIVFTYGAHGKPSCSHQHFNISHSGDCLCLAFHHADIGVDVERIKPRDFDSLAARFMVPEQLEFQPPVSRQSRARKWHCCRKRRMSYHRATVVRQSLNHARPRPVSQNGSTIPTVFAIGAQI